MNKLIYIFALSLIFNPSLWSTNNGEENTSQEIIGSLKIPPGIRIDDGTRSLEATNKKSKSNKLNGVNFRSRISNNVSWFNTWANPNYIGSPVFYNPNIGDDGVYWTVLKYQTYNDPTGIARNWTDNLIIEFYSTDKGENWTINVLDSLKTNQTKFWGPTHGVVFPSKGSTNPLDFDRLIYARVFGTGPALGLEELVVKSSNGILEIETTPRYSVTNNDSGVDQVFNGGNMTATSNEGNFGGHLVSPLIHKGNSQANYWSGHWGYLGVSGDSPRGDNIPSEWYFDKFSHENGSLTESDLQTPTINSDDKGNLYVASTVPNISDFNEKDIFSTTVWKSTDNGGSWSDSTKCPQSIIDLWSASIDIDGMPATDWVDLNRLIRCPVVVYDEDQFSIFQYLMPTRLDGDNTLSTSAWIVELKYDNGVWGIEPVSEVNAFSEVANYPRYYYERSTIIESNFGLTSSWGLLKQTHPKSIELQASITADGSGIVVKYLDYRGMDEVGVDGNTSAYYELEQQWTIYEAEVNDEGVITGYLAKQIDKILVNDIYLSYREINETSWSNNNVTNDGVNYMNTELPKIVNTLDDVSVFWSGRASKEELTSDNANYFIPAIAIPDPLLDLTIQYDIRNHSFGRFDATTGTSPTSSVKNQGKLSFDINNVSPNPAQDYFEVSFSTNKNERVLIKMLDIQGNEVATLVDQILGSGIHGMNFNTAKLSTGSYSLNMYVGSQVVTKIVNIVK